MCGRFTQRWTWRQLHDAAEPFWEVTPGAEDLRPRFNVAPTQAARVIRQDENGTELVPMLWGFPRFESGKRANDVINARSETVTGIPMFRESMASRRCLVPVSGFYEWEKLGDGSKRPWYLTAEGSPVCFFAGLWQDGEQGPEFVVLTFATPDGFEPAIHHRMPGVVTPNHAAAWLGQGLDGKDAKALADPFGGAGTFGVDAWTVSRRVNSPANDAPDLIEPVEAEGGLFG